MTIKKDVLRILTKNSNGLTLGQLYAKLRTSTQPQLTKNTLSSTLSRMQKGGGSVAVHVGWWTLPPLHRKPK